MKLTVNIWTWYQWIHRRWIWDRRQSEDLVLASVSLAALFWIQGLDFEWIHQNRRSHSSGTMFQSLDPWFLLHFHQRNAFYDILINFVNFVCWIKTYFPSNSLFHIKTFFFNALGTLDFFLFLPHFVKTADRQIDLMESTRANCPGYWK